MKKPYRLIVTDDASQTLGEGRMRHFRTMLEAANAFAKSDAPFKAVIFDDGHHARELTEREERMLNRVCDLLGLDINEINAEP